MPNIRRRSGPHTVTPDDWRVLIDKPLDFRFGEMGGKPWAHVEAYWISALTPHIVAMHPTASATVLFEFIPTAPDATRRSIKAANAKGPAK